MISEFTDLCNQISSQDYDYVIDFQGLLRTGILCKSEMLLAITSNR